MDWSNFEAWALADRGLAIYTVQNTVGRLRFMAAHGLDWQRFFVGPDEARLEMRGFLARRKLAGAGGHAVRTYQKAANLVLDCLAMDRKEFQFAKWDLAAEPKGEPRSFTLEQLLVLDAYQHVDPYVSRRRRALIWMTRHTRLRRSELARIRVGDLDEERGLLLVAFPAKRGERRVVPLPFDAFSPQRPLGAWLKVRRPDPASPDALWVGMGPSGRAGPLAFTVGGLSREWWNITQDVGFPCSPLRFRRAGATALDEAGVHPRVIQKLLGHASLTWTQKYLGTVGLERIEADLEAHGVPGFRSRAKSLRERYSDGKAPVAPREETAA